MATSAAGPVVIIGSGIIGQGWAMLFASGGLKVKLYDIEQQKITNSLENIRKEMKSLEQLGSLKGALSAPQQLSLISGCWDLREAVEGAIHIQECVPEDLELKRKVFAQLDLLAGDDVVLASSTSCLLPSRLFAGLAHVRQCIVAHPVNPPYYIPLVELVPHPQTAPSTVDRTYALMQKIGQSPVRVLKEIDGFALNRLQYAVIGEAWRLVQEGIVSPGDLDLVMSNGLGLRYAFLGPLETMHLNAEGMLSYCDRYGEGMTRILRTFGPVPAFSGATAEQVHQAMCAKVPDDPKHLAARRQWRDECLRRLVQLKHEVPPE
ncbi:lambda-crystallin homolog isoform X1 [Rousettus aegyptiacus]|uniref:L-gulonate 3-dehydrogenase n=2 Tax=Rousettus aegyptiacus TaxID=9407 RepID=A0A7J8DWF1_ROUAE|nr:lambda-crystallin homolog isoform X1 [Rousettus aegyptiacus]KAF6427339.1 crystallin lambda 1 [Rousettus aegyptiacus]